MVISGTFLFVVCTIVLLFLLKQLACRGFYSEVQGPYRSFGWHNDPSRQDPQIEPEGDLRLLSTNEAGEDASKRNRILEQGRATESFRKS